MSSKASQPMLVIGLMSGTSYDGIDAALVAIRGGAGALRVELIAFETVAYPKAVRRLIAEISAPPAGTVEKICQANFLLGELFADAAIAVARKARVPMSRVDLIGSHGQTIHHLPKPVPLAGRRVASTLQIGEPSVIAERTGVTTVADFRPRDMACGGQGAPLVPSVDYLLFRHRSRGRLVLNIGGIANFTYLPPACRAEQAGQASACRIREKGKMPAPRVVAFDTGPGNMLLDALASILTGGRQTYDRGGAMAARGTVSEPLLRWLMRHPYLRRQPPKSTGREAFGAHFAEEILRRAGFGARSEKAGKTLKIENCKFPIDNSRGGKGEGRLKAGLQTKSSASGVPPSGGLGLAAADVLATATAFTVESIADAWRRFVRPLGPVHEVIASGGGCHNATLMRRLAEAFDPIPVQLSDDFGIPLDAKEAIAFAILARETMAGRPGNLPSATGARRSAILGKIVPGGVRRQSRQ